MSTDIDLFASAGDGLRPEHFGIDERGRAFVEAPTYARALNYSTTQAALKVVDDDEWGYAERLTPGGMQRMKVIYEDGIWELIFRSSLPSAKSIKAKVKEILRELRETGVVDTRPRPADVPERPMTELEMARGYVAALEKIARIEPAAVSWAQLAEASGDFAVADAAKVLSRDPSITIGRDRLFSYLETWAWIYRGEGGRFRAYQKAIECDRLAERLQSSSDADGSRINRAPQVRVTVKGIHELHRLLGGTGPVLLGVAS